MSEGNKTFLNQGVPLKGESEITQQNVAIDILTITGAPAMTGDFLVLQNSAGTERFVVDCDGNITAGGAVSITDTLTVGNTTTVKPTYLFGALTQSGAAVSLKGQTSISKTMTVGNTTTVKPTYLFGLLTQSGGDVTLKGQTSISKTMTVGNTTTVKPTYLYGALTQSGAAVNLKGAVTHASTVHNTGAVVNASSLTMTLGTGDIVLKKGAIGQTVFSKLQLAVLNTVPTTTTLFSRGDLWIQKATTDIWQIAAYLGPTTTPLMMRSRKDTFVTLGSAS